MMTIYIPGYAKNTRDLDSFRARIYLKLALLSSKNNRKLPTSKEKFMNSAVDLAFRTFWQLRQAGISICKPTALRYKASSQEREQGYQYNPILNLLLEA